MTENGAYVIYATDVLLNPRPAPVAASEPPEGPGAVQDDIVKWDVGGVACRTRCEGLVSCHEDVQVDRQPGPNLVDADALFCLWAGLDRCFACRDEVFAAREAPAPGRPFLAPRDLNTLFIGEAPPTDGGFWRLRNGDELRGRLLPVLPAWPDHVDCDSMEAVEWFVGARYFFVQAMKWPLKDSYSTQTWASQCTLDHAVCSHLEDEIECINPVSIVALGGAAWDACAALSEKHGLPLAGRQGVDIDRLRHHAFRIATGREIPLHATRLPGKQNQRFGWTPVISHDVGIFLNCDRGSLECEKVDRQAAPSNRRRVQRLPGAIRRGNRKECCARFNYLQVPQASCCRTACRAGASPWSACGRRSEVSGSSYSSPSRH